MRPGSPTARRRGDWYRAVAAVVVVLVCAWLDRDGCVVAQQASVFAAIWAGIQFIGQVLGIIGGAVAASLEAVVGYLVAAVAWLSTTIAAVIVSVGSIFAKAWDALKILWSDVLKPALVWIDKTITRVQAWLKDTFGPVFKWLRRVRDELQHVYDKFVRPVVDTIEFIRQLNRVLLTFHITVLQTLDAELSRLEHWIEEPILWLNARLNQVINAVNFIVTADGFFQRYALVRSLGRYAPAWINIAWNHQVPSDVQSQVDGRRGEPPPPPPPQQYGVDLSAFYAGHASRYAEPISAATSVYLLACSASA